MQVAKNLIKQNILEIPLVHLFFEENNPILHYCE